MVVLKDLAIIALPNSFEKIINWKTTSVNLRPKLVRLHQTTGLLFPAVISYTYEKNCNLIGFIDMF